MYEYRPPIVYPDGDIPRVSLLSLRTTESDQVLPIMTSMTKDFVAPELNIVGSSEGIVAVRDLARRVAAGNAKVLITGESGVGKDLVARYIHAHSERASRPFVAVNCAGLSETLLESELFGHVKGSFTGAYRDKMGRLQLAHRGTVFLDELGEMSLRMQAMLLRFLENGEIQPVGGESVSASVNVRVIAATNRNLRALVDQGAFRDDLYYRIKVVHVSVPPLRQRRADIRPLIDDIVARTGCSIRFTEDALRRLEAYGWPGNVRELHNTIEQVSWETGREQVGIEHLPRHVAGAPDPVIVAHPHVADDLYQALTSGRFSFWDHVYLRFMERDLTRQDLRQLVRRGLESAGGNYRAVIPLFRMHSSDYKRFMNFLSAHDCLVDFRDFRRTTRDLASDHGHEKVRSAPE